MYLVLYKKDNRFTSLVLGVHGEDWQELEQYAKANFNYDKAEKMSEKEHAQMLEQEAKANEPTEEERKQAQELAKLEQEAQEFEEAIRELKEEYALADLQGNEEMKEELRAEYMELLGAEMGV